jgi:hypothetical protein
MPLRTAYRVLAATVAHKQPLDEDVKFLRSHARSSESHLSLSDLALNVIGRELAKRKPK